LDHDLAISKITYRKNLQKNFKWFIIFFGYSVKKVA